MHCVGGLFYQVANKAVGFLRIAFQALHCLLELIVPYIPLSFSWCGIRLPLNSQTHVPGTIGEEHFLFSESPDVSHMKQLY